MFEKDSCCTIVPYFEVQEGRLSDFKALASQLISRARTEAGCRHYAFSYHGNTAHCREGYDDATAVLAHLENVDELIEAALAMSELVRLEVHAPQSEIEKLREPMSALSPEFFVLEDGIRRRAEA